MTEAQELSMLANTALYRVPWYMLLWGPGAVRRWNRRRRGRCVACGYDRRGIGAGVQCPECGLGDVAANAPRRSGS